MKLPVILFVFILIFLQSCRKDPPNTSASTLTYGFIAAGNNSPETVLWEGTSSDSGNSSSNGSYYYNNLDFDKDGKIDLTFYESGWSAHGSWEQTDWLNQDSGSFTIYVYTDKNSYPIPLNKGDRIDSTLNWVHTKVRRTLIDEGADYYPNGRGVFKDGNWSGAKDKFLAIRFIKNNITYYGWVRLDCESLLIKEWAVRK